MSNTRVLNIFNPSQTSELVFPHAGSQISAGFPSPAEDYLEPTLDLNRALIKNPSATFYGRVKGIRCRTPGWITGICL